MPASQNVILLTGGWGSLEICEGSAVPRRSPAVRDWQVVGLSQNMKGDSFFGDLVE
jgi:hypothetical protein